MIQGDHTAILLTFIKQQLVIKIFVLSTFKWPFDIHCIADKDLFLNVTCSSQWYMSVILIMQYIIIIWQE